MLRPAGAVPMLDDGRARDLWREAGHKDAVFREGSNNKVYLVNDGERQFALKELKSQAVAYPLEDPCTSPEGKIQHVLQEHVPGVVPVVHLGGRDFPGFIMDAVSGESVDTLKEVADQPTPFPRDVVPDMAHFIGGLARAGSAVQPRLTWDGPYADLTNTHEALTLHSALSRGYHERFRAEFRPIVKALGLSEGLLGSVDGLMRKHEPGPVPLGHRLAPAQMIRDAGGTTWNFDFAGIRRDDPAYLAYRCLDRWNPSETSEQRWDIVREMLSELPNGGRDPSASDRKLIETLVVGGHVATWGLAIATRLARGTDVTGDMDPVNCAGMPNASTNCTHCGERPRSHRTRSTTCSTITWTRAGRPPRTVRAAHTPRARGRLRDRPRQRRSRGRRPCGGRRTWQAGGSPESRPTGTTSR